LIGGEISFSSTEGTIGNFFPSRDSAGEDGARIVGDGGAESIPFGGEISFSSTEGTIGNFFPSKDSAGEDGARTVGDGGAESIGKGDPDVSVVGGCHASGK
jgi:hypothetical protein